MSREEHRILQEEANRCGYSLGAYIRDQAITMALRDRMSEGRLEILPPS